MKITVMIVLLAFAGWAGYHFYTQGHFSLGSGPAVTMDGDRMMVSAGDLEGVFQRRDPFQGVFMLFGGTHVTHKNAISPIFLAGLDIEDARPIYQRYPDFFMCKSPGASLAKPLVLDLSIIPVNSAVLRTLKASLREFEASLQPGGQRVCVVLQGVTVEMESTRIPAQDIDVTDTFPAKTYFFIETAAPADCRQALAGPD